MLTLTAGGLGIGQVISDRRGRRLAQRVLDLLEEPRRCAGAEVGSLGMQRRRDAHGDVLKDAAAHVPHCRNPAPQLTT